MRSGRSACQAAKATCLTMADQTEKGGRCRPKKRKTRPKKRSMEVRLPNSSAVQVGGRQERFFCRLGFQGTTATAPRLAWRKSNQFQAPITCIQPDDARAQMIEAHSPFQQGSGKGAVMGIGGPDQEVHGQARTTTEQGMHPIAPQERTRMVSRSVPHRGIGILSAPGQDGSTINDEIAGSD